MDQKVVENAYNILKEEAGRGSLPTYGYIYDRLGVDSRSPTDRKRGSAILTEVNRASLAEKNVMITAIAVRQESQMPGKMFYVLAEEFGKLKSDAGEEEKAAFWRDELERVYEAYKKDK